MASFVCALDQGISSVTRFIAYVRVRNPSLASCGFNNRIQYMISDLFIDARAASANPWEVITLFAVGVALKRLDSLSVDE